MQGRAAAECSTHTFMAGVTWLQHMLSTPCRHLPCVERSISVLCGGRVAGQTA